MRYESNSRRAKLTVQPKALLKIFTLEQLKYLSSTTKYVEEYILTKCGCLTGEVPSTGGCTEFVDIEKINTIGVKFPYNNLRFSKRDIEKAINLQK